jgi:hypothetical protein
MTIVAEILKNIPLPKMVRVRQRFPVTELPDALATLREQLRRPQISDRVVRGMRVAIAVGSRGMADIPQLVRVVVEELKAREAIPFIVPAMGSHGGATAQGQIAVLASLGITEISAGCPILSSMDVVELGVLSNGLPVLIDKHAFAADGIIVINRVKAHNAFTGTVESGLSKMITIGLGKQKGADSCHGYGFGHMAEVIVEMAKRKLQQAPFLFAVGTVENAYDKIAEIVVVPPEEIIVTDQQLLVKAKASMPKILFQPVDVLIVDQLGKEFSGGGMDSHTVGRSSTPYVSTAALPPARLVVLDITDRSHGNACGMGLADFTTRRLFNKINLEFTYANILTSTATLSAKIPLIMDSDRLAIQGAIKTCNAADMKRLRVVRISNTLQLSEIYLSDAMLAEAQQCDRITVLTEPAAFAFNAAGNFSDIGFQ